MADVISPNMKFFCHQCAREVIPSVDFLCPHCHTGFIEEFSPLFSDGGQLNQASHYQPPATSGIQNEASSISNFFQNFLRRGSATNTYSTPSPAINSLQSAHSSNRIDDPALLNSVTSSGPQIAIPPINYHTQTPFHHATGLETLLEQIMNWVGNGNAVLQMDPGGLITFMEYHTYDNDPGSSTHHPQPFPLFGNVRDYAWGPGALENIMEQLFNQIEGQGIPPAPPHIIENLPTEIVQSTDIDQELQCSICMEYFKIKEKVKALPCEHWFHKECIIPWLELHGTCPICRKSVSDPHAPHPLLPSYGPQAPRPPPTMPPSGLPPPSYRRQFSHPTSLAPSHPHDLPPTTSSNIHRPIPRSFSNRNVPPDSTTSGFKTSGHNTILTSSGSVDNLNNIGTSKLINHSNLTPHEQEHFKSPSVITTNPDLSRSFGADKNVINENRTALDTDNSFTDKPEISQVPRYLETPSPNQSKRPKPSTSNRMMDLDFD